MSNPAFLRVGRAPFVGRGRELAILANSLGEARAAHAVIVLLAGEPGIGKTRLLEEFPGPTLAAGVTVLHGGSSQAHGMPPYLPFLEALGAYVAAAPVEALRAAIGAGAASVARVLPEVSVRLGEVQALPGVQPEQERLRLFDAVAGFVGAIAARSGGALVLVLDDLHWADEATCDLLVHVARRLQHAPLLVLGAYRDAEADENRALGRALAELNRLRLLEVLRVHPFEPNETARLAAGLLRGEVRPQVIDLLHRHAEGNPFFEEELLRALTEDGTLVDNAGSWELSRTPQGLLPTGILDAIRLRLARLPEPVVDILRVASVIGRSWSLALLAPVADLDLERAEDLVLVAVRARLVRPQSDGGYAFVHDKVREALYEEAPVHRRRRLHQAIGEGLEREPAQESARRLAELTFHFVRASDVERGVAYALDAADHALAASAPAEAVEHFRAAVDLLGRSADYDARRTRALLGLGAAATLSGDYRLAEESYRSVAQTSLEAGQHTEAARAWHGLAGVRWRQEAVEDARAAFEQALAVLGPVDSTEAAETLLRLAELHAVSLGLADAGLAYGERALAMVERLDDRRLEAAVCFTMGSVRTWRCEPAEGRALLERALALAKAHDDPVLIAEVCGILASACAFTGDLRASLAVTLEREQAALRTQDLYQLRHVPGWQAQMAMFRGDWAECEQLLEQAQQVVDRLETPEPRAIARCIQGGIDYYRGRFRAAEAEFRAAFEEIRAVETGSVLWVLPWLPWALAELGRSDEALGLWAEVEHKLKSRDPRSTQYAFAVAMATFGYQRLGATEQAAACYTRLAPFSGIFIARFMDHALGVAAICAGDHFQAAAHLTAAEAQARRSGARAELALIVLRRGQLEHDPVVVTEGLRLCDQLGMQALAGSILDRQPLPAQRAIPGGLTHRELEVLRLVSQGRTNRQIAEELVLSERTVANHLGAILAKTGSDNRAAAATFALRNGLA